MPLVALGETALLRHQRSDIVRAREGMSQLALLVRQVEGFLPADEFAGSGQKPVLDLATSHGTCRYAAPRFFATSRMSSWRARAKAVARRFTCLTVTPSSSTASGSVEVS